MSDVVEYDVFAVDFGFTTRVDEDKIFESVVASRLPVLCGGCSVSSFDKEFFDENFDLIQKSLGNQQFDIEILKIGPECECKLNGKPIRDLIES